MPRPSVARYSSVAVTRPRRDPGARSGDARARCVVVVLGDLGRSPRMLLHALALAEVADVDLVGYAGAELPAAVADHPAIAVHHLPAEPDREPGRRPWLGGTGRLARRTLRLSRVLLRELPRPDLLLVQNPPALPSLAVVWLTARLRGARWMIDWHNLASSMVALELGAQHRAARLMERCEVALGRRADGHLSVSSALRETLVRRWGIGPANVVHDRAWKTIEARGPGDAVSPRDGDAVVVVSPSSWTLDEDHPLLLSALDLCQASIERERAAGVVVPRIVFLLTGIGPCRAEFESAVREQSFADIEVRTAWLSYEDYLRLLASADLGLCLHRSSSGLDLPMKIADMLGAGLPVLALDYGPVLMERFRPGVHGETFTTAEDLAAGLIGLVRGFPGPSSRLASLRRTLREHPPQDWISGWRREALPAIEPLLRAPTHEEEAR
jgi:beta-1,4-mannosyltransferase